jgi:virginiamycin B lyase
VPWRFIGGFPGDIGRLTTAGDVTYYSGSGIDPQSLAVGPDGALWFSDGTGSIGRITVGGKITIFTRSGISSPVGITAGPGKALWFTNGGNNTVGRITTNGKVTTFKGSDISKPTGIVDGSDGALWFNNHHGSQSWVVRMTTAGKMKIYAKGRQFLSAIAAGPDKAVWTAEFGTEIFRITTAGKVTGFKLGNTTQGIAAGPDKAMWFFEYLAEDTVIGRINFAGKVTNTYPITGFDQKSMMAGPDGAMWFINQGVIERITTSVTH